MFRWFKFFTRGYDSGPLELQTKAFLYVRLMLGLFAVNCLVILAAVLTHRAYLNYLPYQFNLILCVFGMFLLKSMRYTMSTMILAIGAFLSLVFMVALDPYNVPFEQYRYSFVAGLTVFMVGLVAYDLLSILVTALLVNSGLVALFVWKYLLPGSLQFGQGRQTDVIITFVTCFAILGLFGMLSLFFFLTNRKLVDAAYKSGEVARQAGMAAEDRLRILDIYTKKSLVNLISQGRNPLTLPPENRDTVILFSDIRDFAHLSQTLEPPSVLELLNGFFESMTTVIHHHDGEIDKLIGDCLMATFDNPDAAVSAAVAMKRSLFELNKTNQARGLPELRSGIGIHCGTVLWGNIGSSAKLDLTIIGDPVNVASRIESLSRAYFTDILISGETKSRLKHRITSRHIDTVRVKGRNDPVELHEVYTHHFAESVEAKKKHETIFRAAFDAYVKGDFPLAIQHYMAIGGTIGEHLSLDGFYIDPIVNVMLDRSLTLFQAQKSGELRNWDGVFTFSSK